MKFLIILCLLSCQFIALNSMHEDKQAKRQKTEFPNSSITSNIISKLSLINSESELMSQISNSCDYLNSDTKELLIIEMAKKLSESRDFKNKQLLFLEELNQKKISSQANNEKIASDISQIKRSIELLETKFDSDVLQNEVYRLKTENEYLKQTNKKLEDNLAENQRLNAVFNKFKKIVRKQNEENK